MSACGPQVGDRVVYLPHADNPPRSAWATTYANVPGIVVEPNAVRSSSADDGFVVWNPATHSIFCAPSERLKVVEAATYEPVYDFRPGQVWQSANGGRWFYVFDGNVASFVDVCGGTYPLDFPTRPLTLLFDPSAVSDA